ncbi:MAG: AAA family ATPase [Bacilli bacterium]|nr:AAA family ATPase [Bacilli bacterium]
MIFKKMNLINFRQFKGNTEIVFSTDNVRNVTVITGDNGSGKTTLLQAFNWCLYGQLKLDSPDKLINEEVFSSINVGEKARVEVEIEFEHLKKVYTCRNYIDYIRNTEGKVNKIDEDQLFTITDPSSGETKRTNQNSIREIFPSDLSSYFLFDGERMQNLVDNQRIGKKDLSNAVKNLLGLDVLENSKYHLQKVKKEFEAEFVSDKSSRLEQINLELQKIDDSIEIEAANKEKYENELMEYEIKQSEIDKILKSYSGLKELQSKRIEYSKQMERIIQEIEVQKNDIFKSFGFASSNLFLGSSFKKVTEKLSKSDLKDKGIEGINGPAVDYLLERGLCICGCNLEAGTESRKKLEQLKEFLPPASYSTLLKGLEVSINNATENNERYYDNFNKSYDRYNNLINQKDLLTNRINDNEKLIADAGDKDLNEFNQAYIDYRNRIAYKNQSIGSCKAQIENYNEKLRRLEDERSKITVTSNINDSVQFKVDVCEKLIAEITKRLARKEKEVKEEMQLKTSELLSKMLNSNKQIIIEDDYNFTVTDEYHTSILSEGEKIVTSFAFVGSIISVAKNILEQEDDSKFTLVMDAPFAKLDLTHRKNVTNYIPLLTDQIILFSADSQWDNVVENSLIGKIGLMYNINKIKSGFSVVELIKKGANL